MTDSLRAALELVSRGWSVFPVDHPDLPTCAGRHAPDRPCDGQRGKHPEPTSWPAASTRKPSVVRARFDCSRGPRNAAVDCGKASLLVIDEDSPGELDRLANDYGQGLPDTYTVKTRKGRHLYLRQPPSLPFTNRRGRLVDYRIDVRGRGGYVIGAGSVHESGHVYRALDPDARVADVPQWLAELLLWAPPVRQIDPDRAGTVEGLAGVLRIVLDAPVGERNTRLFWSACRLAERVRAGLLDQGASDAMLLDAATSVGLATGAAEATIASARRRICGG